MTTGTISQMVRQGGQVVYATQAPIPTGVLELAKLFTVQQEIDDKVALLAAQNSGATFIFLNAAKVIVP